MDLLGYIKDPGIIAGIIGVTEFLKYFFYIKSKRILMTIPFVLGLIAGIAQGWGNVGTCAIMGVSYAGVASFVYQFGKNFIPKNEEKDGNFKAD